jgi:pseudouridine synthase
MRVHFLLNKPKGVVCTLRDPRGRPLASELVPTMGGRVFCVGGLDDEATGVVILTNDGELTSQLTDPRLGLEMTYVIEVDGCPDDNDMNELKRGMFIEGRRRASMRLKVLQHSIQRSVLEIRTSEGRNQVLRSLFARLKHKIRRMKRTAMGPIAERGIKIGHFRPLWPREVEQLYAMKPVRRPRRNQGGISCMKPQ